MSKEKENTGEKAKLSAGIKIRHIWCAMYASMCRRCFIRIS